MSYAVTVEEFENALWDLFSEAIGHTRIFYGQTNFIKPDLDYITIRIANMTPIESPGYLVGHLPGESEISYIHYNIILDIRAYRGSAKATAATLRHSLDMRELWYKHIQSNNIGYLSSSTISDVSVPLDGEQWEQRAAMTSIFHVIIKQSDIAGSDGAVETVLTEETAVKEDDTTIVQTDTITLN